MAEVSFRAAAEADLAEILSYTTAQFGRDAASSYLSSFEDAFGFLSQYPEGGSVFRRQPSIIRSLSCASHRIFYVTDQDEVSVIRILHHSQDQPQAIAALDS